MAAFGSTVTTQLGRAIKPPAKPADTRTSYGRPFGGFPLPPAQHGTGAGLTGLAPAQKPPAPPAPSPPKASGTTTAPANSPLDATYYQQIAGDQLKLGNSLNSLGSQSQNANTALQSALAQLAYQQPRDSLNLEQGANQRGALYSSAYTQNLGNLANSYQTRQSAATTANSQKQASIAAQIAALNQGEPITEAGAYDSAVARSARNAAANPATGQPAIPPPLPKATITARTTAAKGQASSARKQGTALAKAIAAASQRKTGFAALTGLKAGRR